MKILAIDLGKFKSVACVYESTTGEHTFSTVSTKPGDLQDLFSKHRPERVFIEFRLQRGASGRQTIPSAANLRMIPSMVWFS